MDSNRPHEYMTNADECALSNVYIGRGVVGNSNKNTLDDLRSQHLQYYTTNRDLPVKKPATNSYASCTCNGTSNTMCNNCRTTGTLASVTRSTTEELWSNAAAEHNVAPRQSPIYINTNNSHTSAKMHASVGGIGGNNSSSSRNTAYWTPNEHIMHQSSTKGSEPPYLTNRKPETNYDYKLPTASATVVGASITRPSAINQQSHYTDSRESRYYGERKYSNSSVASTPSNSAIITSYAQVPVTSGVCNSSIYDAELALAQQHPQHTSEGPLLRSEHIINPSNMLAPKEQQPSPNYARKYPQIYAVPPPECEQQQPQFPSSHKSLYMATPQFSSENFQTIAQSAIQKYTRSSPQQSTTVDYRSTGGQLATGVESTSKFHEGQYSVTENLAYRIPTHGKPPPNLTTSSRSSTSSATAVAPYANMPVSSGANPANYYMAGSHNNHHGTKTIPRPAELTPVIMKSAVSQYAQYSKNPLPQTAQYSTSGAGRGKVVNYIKVESGEAVNYEAHLNSSPVGSSNTRGLYNNPYVTPPQPLDNFCKERSYSNSYRGESPQSYPTKYGKLVQEANSSGHKLNLHTTQTPPPPPPSFQGASPHISRPHSASSTSSTAATAAATRSQSASNSYYYGTPSPAAATAASPSPQMHHGMYTPTPPPGAAVIQTSHPHHIHHQQQQPPSAQLVMPPGYTASGDICCSATSSMLKTAVNSSSASSNRSSGPTITQHKKISAQKPNYRELINELIIRNTTSEQELNMQIIKKTLNVANPSSTTQNSVARTTSAALITSPKPQAHSSVIHQSVPPTVSTLALHSNSSSNINPIISTTTASEPLMPHIKQEPVGETKPAAHSPLDLSMRTIKTKADSTEYKYRHTSTVDYKHGLPRFDITPNFSAATVAHRLSTPPTATASGQRHEQQVSTPPARGASSTAYQYNQSYTPPQHTVVPPPVSSLVASSVAPTSKSLVIKSTSMPRQDVVALAQCARPSVLVEVPNPNYTKPSTTTVQPTRQMLACDQLPPDTSIVVLPKNVPVTTQPTAMTTSSTHQDQMLIRSPHSAYSSKNEVVNPNYLGRKRHLQEYSLNANSKHNHNNNTQEHCNKQPRYHSPGPVSHIALAPPSQPILPRAAEIPVIAINEQALELERRRLESNINNNSNANAAFAPAPQVIIVPTICKQEPITPTGEHTPTSLLSPAPTPIKSERIRTKAELKGFTFTTPTVADSTTTNVSQPTVKTEPEVESSEIPTVPVPKIELPSIPGLMEDFNAGNLLDFGWSNTCNSFVEQLRTTKNNKRQQQIHRVETATTVVVVKQTLPTASTNIKLELSEDDIPVAIIAQKKLFNTDSTESRHAVVVTTTTIGTNSTSLFLQKKLSKLDREKKRMVQEQRLAARLPDDSSSESDNELDKRKNERQNKPLRKGGKIRRLQLQEKKDDIKQRMSSEPSGSYTTSELTDTSDKQRKQPVRRASNETDQKDENKEQETKEKPTTKKLSSDDKLTDKEQTTKQTLTNVKNKSVERSPTPEAIKSDKVQYSGPNRNNFKLVKQNKETDEKKSEEEETTEKCNSKTNTSERKPNIPSASTVNKKFNKTKIALNTMTRSKHKEELANSKVLRNDKIIRNSTTKIKRKYVRKLAAAKEAAKEVNIIGTRLRAKINSNKLPLNGRKQQKQSRQTNGKETSAQNLKSPATGGKQMNKTKQQQQNIYLEMYRYKRALKIPPSLIMLDHMNHHKIAASLPDLERDNALEELSGFKRKPKKVPKSMKEPSRKNAPSKHLYNDAHGTVDSPKSIIDLLHSRVTSSAAGSGSKQCSKIVNTITKKPSSVQNFSETSQNTESTSVYELPLPTPIKPGQDVDEMDMRRHFSIFDTKVLQSKTRTESKMQQKREIIREIFVGPDRPASAPPDVRQDGDDDGLADFLSYTKCEQYLEQMNIIISQNKDKFARINRVPTAYFIKKEEEHDVDTECSASAADIDEKNDNNTMLNTSGAHVGGAGVAHHRRRGKYMRRKGSSGFDYIRKKKKPTPTNASANNVLQTNQTNSVSNNQLVNQAQQQHMQTALVKLERIDPDDCYGNKEKTEDDICREIQKWVLNKGVGQSTMHKAARQGYIDVVVYCLDRLGMNPNQKDNAGYTPLHEACTHGWLEIARILLQYGANHSEAAQSGIRPLHGAIENDHEEVVRLLLSYGADPLLATYSGQTPLMLASSKVMRVILSTHLTDAQNAAADIKPIRFPGPWQIFDATEYGYDIFDNVPNIVCDMSRALNKNKALVTRRRSSTTEVVVSNGFMNSNATITADNTNGENATKTATTTTTATTKNAMNTVKEEVETKCTAVSNGNSSHIDAVSNVDDDNTETAAAAANGNNNNKQKCADENSEDAFEFEETDVLLPPLYLLKDEGSDKWVLLNDLCNLLKVKSKDTLLNKICPNTTSTSASNVSLAQKNLLREYKMSDFLEKATCLQLLCAGEKLNIGASKVVLIKYNESVKNLLGVKTILMQF